MTQPVATGDRMPAADVPHLAITLGDPRGIGPEVTIAAVRRIRMSGHTVHITLIGPEGTGAEAVADAFVPIGTWHVGGAPSEAGRLAGHAIEEATRRSLDGEFGALITAPIDKAALHAAGYDWPGHTEMLAALSGVRDVSMLMCAERTAIGGPLRIVLATTHIPLGTVTRMLTTDLLVRQTRLLDDALRSDWSIGEPAIAFCAVNPHASDGGIFGDEEERVMRPAIDRLRTERRNVSGPYPADTVFLRASRGEFDAVVAPYHDVGMAAFKTAAFGTGVNVTLGLPFVRTSPDHGTALDIAGRGIADASSMEEAIQLALVLAARRRTHVVSS